MREDISQYVGKQAGEVEIRTIHGFCYGLLREESRRLGDRLADAVVCDEVDTEELLQSILSSQYPWWERGEVKPEEDGDEQETHFEIFNKKGGLRNFVSAIKHIREEQGFYGENEAADYQKAFDFLQKHRAEQCEALTAISAKRGWQVCDEVFLSAMKRHAGRLVFTYDDHLRQSNRVDYDDLILFASRALKNEEPRARWAARYRYITIDEMQDTSLLEYSVLTRLFSDSKVMMCGDFFQSIYGWRGSKPEYVLTDFIKTYHAKVYMLSQNYRSTQMLTNATFGYLCATYPDLVGKYCPKDLQVASPDEGDKILCMGFDNRREEAAQIYRYLRKNIEQGVTSLCVIARSNFYVSMLSRAFEECNQAYPIEQQLRFFTAEEDLQFYKKPIVKDVLAMLKLLLNQTDRISMERITEKYVRLVGAKTVEWLRMQNRVGASIVSFLDKQTYTHEDPYHVLIDAFKKGEIVVYDTETTGLDLTKDEMVQLAAIRINTDGEVTGVFEKMIVPTLPIGEGAYATHGFDMDYILAHGVVFDQPAEEEKAAETVKETELAKETEKVKETEPVKETEKVKETEPAKENEKAKETEKTVETKKTAETEADKK
jgi:DNA helicase-2/ATP-dependent DNA helicase PcrA